MWFFFVVNKPKLTVTITSRKRERHQMRSRKRNITHTISLYRPRSRCLALSLSRSFSLTHLSCLALYVVFAVQGRCLKKRKQNKIIKEPFIETAILPPPRIRSKQMASTVRTVERGWSGTDTWVREKEREGLRGGGDSKKKATAEPHSVHTQLKNESTLKVIKENKKKKEKKTCF